MFQFCFVPLVICEILFMCPPITFNRSNFKMIKSLSGIKNNNKLWPRKNNNEKLFIQSNGRKNFYL